MFPTLQQQKDPLSISREHNILKGPVSVSKSSVKEGVFFGCFLCLGGKEKSIFITALEYSLVSSPYRMPGYATYLPLSRKNTHKTNKH